MHANSEMSISKAVFTAFRLMVDNLPRDEGSVFAVEAKSYLQEKFPDVMINDTGKSVCERRVTHSRQENQITRLMEESKNFNLVLHLNGLLNEFNILIGLYQNQTHEHGQSYFAKKICMLGCEINAGVVEDIGGDVELELSEQRAQWREAIKILCEGCIQFKSGETPSGAQSSVQVSESSLSQFFDKLCRVYPDKSDRIAYLKYTIEKNYYDGRCKENLSELILTQFIGSGKVQIFCDTLQLLLEYHGFVPQNDLVYITPQQATSIQAAAAETSIYDRLA